MAWLCVASTASSALATLDQSSNKEGRMRQRIFIPPNYAFRGSIVPFVWDEAGSGRPQEALDI